MGWTYFAKRHGVSTLETLKSHSLQWTNLPEERRPQVIDAAQVGTVCYFAVRNPAPYYEGKPDGSYIHDADGSVTWCAVFLTNNVPRASDGYTFGYKDMEETMGPCEATCPARILDKLSQLVETPGRENWGIEWRKRCREHAAAKRARPKLVPGAIVKLPSPATFADGRARDRFEVVQVQGWNKKKTRFRCLDTGAMCILDARMKAQLQAAT